MFNILVFSLAAVCNKQTTTTENTAFEDVRMTSRRMGGKQEKRKQDSKLNRASQDTVNQDMRI